MTTDPGSAPGTQTTAQPPPVPPANPLRRFRRSRSDRVLTGVCGGLGEATGVDPVVYRVLIFVLAFFGGAGLLVYAACWLLMPEADRDDSLAEQALARGKGDRAQRSRVILAVVLSLAAIVALGAVSNNSLGGLLAVLFAVAVYLLIRRQDSPPAAASFPTPAPYAPPPGSGAPSGDPAAAASGWDLGKPEAPVVPPAPPVPPVPTASPAPKAPKPPRERSVLGRLTFGLVLVGLGVLAAVDMGGVDVPFSAYPALVLALAGAGLLVATRYGRARGLIALGVLATLALPVAAVADVVDGEWTGRDRFIQPADAAGIAPQYEYGAGRIELDLTRVDFDGRDVPTRIDLGAGELIITVPAEVDVDAEVDLGVGDAEIFSVHGSGLGVSKHVTDTGSDGTGGGSLHLRVDQGIGRLEVRRAAA